jgi:hypothetical protein
MNPFRNDNMPDEIADADSEEHLMFDSDPESDSDAELDDYDSDTENVFYDDQQHLDSDKENDTYYIGMCSYMRYRKIYMMTNSVSTKTFAKYPIDRIQKYLYSYSVIKPLRINNETRVEIMKTHILEDDSLSVVLKTHWIRLIQRCWKKVFQQRCEIIRKRRNPKTLLLAQQTGKYPYGLNHIPGIRGMLNSLTYQRSSNIGTD